FALLLRDLVVGDDADHRPTAEPSEDLTNARDGPAQLLVVGTVPTGEVGCTGGRYPAAAESGQLPEPFHAGVLDRDPAREHVRLHDIEEARVFVPHGVEGLPAEPGFGPPQAGERPSAGQRMVEDRIVHV